VWRSLAAAAVLVLPIALTVGSTVRHDVDAIREHARLSAVEADVEPPFAFPGYRNVPLLLGMRRLVPDDARIAFVPRGGAAARRDYVRTGWVRWAAFVLAPRLVVAGSTAPWIVSVGRPPGDAGIVARRTWRFGDDWLVER
jgi:hypothetical protein